MGKVWGRKGNLGKDGSGGQPKRLSERGGDSSVSRSRYGKLESFFYVAGGGGGGGVKNCART